MIKEEENSDWFSFHHQTEIDSQHFHSLITTPDHSLTPDFEALTSKVFKENDMIDERDQIIFGPGISENQLNLAVSWDHHLELSSISQMLTSSTQMKKKRTKKSRKETSKEKKIAKDVGRNIIVKIEDLWAFKIKNPNFFRNE